MVASSTITLDTLGQIGVTVSDVDRSAGFYRDTLGVPFLFSYPGLAFFRLGEVRLMLTLPESGEPRQMASPLYFRVREIAHVQSALAERGVEFVDAPHIIHRDDRMELWMTFFRDPDGNLLALMEEKAPDAG
jgi:catechol 2,3-dioxygenase-like lactoylglutathione lyase family enzyme